MSKNQGGTGWQSKSGGAATAPPPLTPGKSAGPQAGQGWNAAVGATNAPTNAAPATEPAPDPETPAVLAPSPPPLLQVNDAAEPGDPLPCVGLPVQYHTKDGPVVARLAGSNRLRKDLWDLTVEFRMTGSPSTRTAVPFRRTPALGAWTHLPGWRWPVPEQPKPANPPASQPPPK